MLMPHILHSCAAKIQQQISSYHINCIIYTTYERHRLISNSFKPTKKVQ